MRFTTILISLLAFGPTMFGQNNLFIPFGKTAEYVKTFLDSRDYIFNIQEDQEMQSVRAVLDRDQSKHVEYVFAEGTHYATTVTRNYGDRKIARRIQKNCLSYMESVKLGKMKNTTNNNITCYTSIAKERIIKLFVIDHPTSTTLTLTSFSREHGPMVQETDFFYEEDLLQKKYISN